VLYLHLGRRKSGGGFAMAKPLPDQPASAAETVPISDRLLVIVLVREPVNVPAINTAAAQNA